MKRLITSVSDICKYAQDANTCLLLCLHALKLQPQQLFVLLRNINNKIQLDFTSLSNDQLYDYLYEYLYTNINVNINEFNQIYKQLLQTMLKKEKAYCKCISEDNFSFLQLQLSSLMLQALVEINSLLLYSYSKITNTAFNQTTAYEKNMNVNLLHLAKNMLEFDYDILQYCNNKCVINKNLLDKFDFMQFTQNSKYLFMTYAATTPQWSEFLKLYNQL